MEGLEREQPLQTGEAVIIVVVLLMWAGEYRMGSQGLGSVVVGTVKVSVRRKGRESSGWGRLVEGNQDKFEREREGSCKPRDEGCMGTRNSRPF